MQRYILLGGAAMTVLLMANASVASAAPPRVLQESEWPASVVMDVGSDAVSNCAKAGGTLSHPDRAHYICYITPKDCVQKGWQVIERDAVMSSSARVQACHKKSS